jgi:hypothetical protein
MTAPVEKVDAQPAGGRSNEDRDSLARLGAELLRRSEDGQAEMKSAWKKLLHDWNIHGEPIGAQQLRELIQRETGNIPENNEFSRDLIAQRQERQA